MVALLSSPSSATLRPSTASDRNYFKSCVGDRNNGVRAAVGHNFRLPLLCFAELLRIIIRAFIETESAENIA